MPDLSSKSEGYSSILHDAAVPSTPFCCYIIFNTLGFYNNITGFYGKVFTAVFFILFVFTLILTVSGYRIYFRNKVKVSVTAAATILICSILSFFLNSRIHNLTSGRLLPEHIENFSASADEISLKRYSSEIYFHTEENSGTKVNGILYYQGETVFNRGDLLFIHKKIRKIPPGDTGRFNTYLISRGIHFTSSITDSDITVLKKNDLSLRSFIQKSLLQKTDLLFSQPASGLIKALLTGNQNYIGKDVIIRFRDAGVLHCLSASGLHVAIFASIPVFLLAPFIRRNIAMTGSLLLVLFYLYITDMPVPLLRAVIMFCLFYLQLLLYRRRNVFNYLMLTCSIILMISPWEIFSPGFQLSFAATAGILIFYRQYRQSLQSLPGIIADTAAVTLSAQILTIPVIIFHMNQLNTAGLFSNIIVIPLISLVTGLSMFTIVISFMSVYASTIAGTITSILIKSSFAITDFIYNLKLNFYVYDPAPLLFALVLLSAIPLINHREFLRLRFLPVLLSVLLSTLYLKRYNCSSEGIYTVKEGNSLAEIRIENRQQVLKLDLQEGADTEKIIRDIQTWNPDIKIIELRNSGSTNMLASKKIINDYIISEYRFCGIPDINNLFKKIIFQLEKDNVVIKYMD